MRLKIIFLPMQRKFVLPINLNAFIRSLIREHITEFGSLCEEQVYGIDKSRGKFNEEFDCYTFSQLHIPHRQIKGDQIVGEQCEVSLFVSSPNEPFIYCLMQALSELDKVMIADTPFSLSELEILPPLTIVSPAFFSCMSPIVVTHPSDFEYIQFALPQDYDLSKYLSEIMRLRYEDCTGVALPEAEIQLQFDANYVLKRGGKITKLINIPNPENGANLRVKGFLAPIILSGDEKLIRFAFDSGLGVMTSDGFGMLESLGAPV